MSKSVIFVLPDAQRNALIKGTNNTLARSIVWASLTGIAALIALFVTYAHGFDRGGVIVTGFFAMLAVSEVSVAMNASKILNVVYTLNRGVTND